MNTKDYRSVGWKKGMRCTVDRADGTTFVGEVIGVDFSTNVIRVRPMNKEFSCEYYYYSQVTLDGQQKGICGRSRAKK